MILEFIHSRGQSVVRGRFVARSVRLMLLMLSTTLVLSACGPNSPQVAGPTSSSPPSATASVYPTASSTVGAGAATAIDAYRGMWKAYMDAGRIPDPAFPDLARYAQGDALQLFVRGLTSMKNDGLVSKGDIILNPKLTAVHPNTDPPTAEIEDCVDTSASQLVKKDGSAYQDKPGGHQSVRAVAARVGDGVWIMTQVGVFDVGTC
jgi:hypothetical protein